MTTMLGAAAPLGRALPHLRVQEPFTIAVDPQLVELLPGGRYRPGLVQRRHRAGEGVAGNDKSGAVQIQEEARRGRVIVPHDHPTVAWGQPVPVGWSTYCQPVPCRRLGQPPEDQTVHTTHLDVWTRVSVTARGFQSITEDREGRWAWQAGLSRLAWDGPCPEELLRPAVQALVSRIVGRLQRGPGLDLAHEISCVPWERLTLSQLRALAACTQVPWERLTAQQAEQLRTSGHHPPATAPATPTPAQGLQPLELLLAEEAGARGTAEAERDAARAELEAVRAELARLREAEEAARRAKADRERLRRQGGSGGSEPAAS